MSILVASLFMCTLCLWSLYYPVCYCYDQSDVEVSLNLVETNCSNQYECFHSLVKCDKDKEIFRIRLDWLSSSEARPLTILNLTIDKTVAHFKVSRTSLNEYKIARTDQISDSVYYQRESTFPRQFKSVVQLFGSIEGETNSFVRAVGHFTQCNRLQLYAFIRQSDRLYQIRPKLNNSQNIHLVITNIPQLDETFGIFSQNSKAIRNALEFDDQFMQMQRVNQELYEQRKQLIENKYCLIHTVVDQSFYLRMNNNSQQVISYVQLALMLANEIHSNANWPKDEYGLYGFALNRVDIDLTFAQHLDKFNESSIRDMLLQTDRDIRGDNCLVYLFTGRNIFRDNHEDVMHGISRTGGIFTSDNVGAISIANCVDDPWRLRCLLTFAHELEHSLGANHDEEDNLMNQVNDMYSPVEAASLKLSNASIKDITRSTFKQFKNKMFIGATDWSRCGNSVVEQGEQCDEGSTEMCCDSKCQLKTGAKCSPLNSLCCNEKCQFKQSASPCLPWNYCSDKSLYCKHSQLYCRFESVIVICEDSVKSTTDASPTRDVSITKGKPTSATNKENIFQSVDTEPDFVWLIFWFSILFFVVVMVTIIMVFCLINYLQRRRKYSMIDNQIEMNNAQIESFLPDHTTDQVDSVSMSSQIVFSRSQSSYLRELPKKVLKRKTN